MVYSFCDMFQTFLCVLPSQVCKIGKTPNFERERRQTNEKHCFTPEHTSISACCDHASNTRKPHSPKLLLPTPKIASLSTVSYTYMLHASSRLNGSVFLLHAFLPFSLFIHDQHVNMLITEASFKKQSHDAVEHVS